MCFVPHNTSTSNIHHGARQSTGPQYIRPSLQAFPLILPDQILHQADADMTLLSLPGALTRRTKSPTIPSQMSRQPTLADVRDQIYELERQAAPTGLNVGTPHYSGNIFGAERGGDGPSPAFRGPALARAGRPVERAYDVEYREPVMRRNARGRQPGRAPPPPPYSPRGFGSDRGRGPAHVPAPAVPTAPPHRRQPRAPSPPPVPAYEDYDLDTNEPAPAPAFPQGRTPPPMAPSPPRPAARGPAFPPAPGPARCAPPDPAQTPTFPAKVPAAPRGRYDNAPPPPSLPGGQGLETGRTHRPRQDAQLPGKEGPTGVGRRVPRRESPRRRGFGDRVARIFVDVKRY